MEKVKILISYGNDVISGDLQSKTFKNEDECIKWLTKNCEKVMRINGHLTFGKLIDPCELSFFIHNKSYGKRE